MSNGEGWQPDPGSPGGPSAEPPRAAAPSSAGGMPAPVSAMPTVPSSSSVSTTGYPIDLGVDAPYEIARWRVLVQWILAIPLYIILYVLRIAAEVCALIGWFVALFTGQLPEGLGNFIAGYYRYAWRTYSYAWFLRDSYPPFGPELGYRDPRDDPAWFEVRRGEGLSRLAVLFRFILVIPQAIVIFFVGIVLYLAMLVAFFAVLITGHWPEGLRAFVIAASRWVLRVDAWFFLLANPYPPFSLD
jgi:Domain of unknown function (DUF4389)